MDKKMTLETKKGLTKQASVKYQADKAGYKATASKEIEAILKGPASGIVLLANRLAVNKSDNGYEQCFQNIARKGIYGDLSEKQMAVLTKGLTRKSGFLGYQIAKSEVYAAYFKKNSK